MLLKKTFYLSLLVFLGVCASYSCDKRCCKEWESPSKDDCKKCLVQPTAVASATPPAVETSASQSSGNAQTWQAQVERGDYATLISETNQTIAAGRGAPGYSQAWLYRGVAEFKLGTDLKTARDDFARATELADQLSLNEQILLYRSQMVVLIKLGDKTTAEQAYQHVLKIAPAELQDALKQEYKNAFKP